MDHAPLMLGVSGLRGLIGKTLTPDVATRYGAAYGQWLRNHRRPGLPSDAAPLVVIGRDSRPSGPMIESAVVAGLVATGCRVVQLGIATTPGTAVMVDHHQADGGVIITASHNPLPWNGIKALTYEGSAPPADQAAELIDLYHKASPRYAAVEDLQPPTPDDTAAEVHLGRILRHIDVKAVRARKLRVVLDSVHGAGGPSTARLLAELGVELIHHGAEPTGLFQHPPEPTRDNLVSLSKAVLDHKAHLGLAQDPDADRLAVVDEKGAYIGEEYTLALCALHMLNRLGRPQGATSAANLSTSRMIDDVFAQVGGTVYRTPVGEANVAATMRQKHCVIGGEGNGGVIWPDIVQVRDSLAGAALLLEMLAQQNKPLSAIASTLPAYAIVKDKVDTQPGMAQKIKAALAEQFKSQKLDLQDGIRIDWPDRWVHVRPSNTEPIIRLIAEAKEPKAAEALIAQVRAHMATL
ncbi:MAG: phosphoglucosamine mutase [Phycisphaeraceae bacterium]|nr:phosphoglucosamine mutase [Phycisphaeraceae bacterium]